MLLKTNVRPYGASHPPQRDECVVLLASKAVVVIVDGKDEKVRLLRNRIDI